MPPASSKPNSKIGTLNESPLHRDLKHWYQKTGDQVEVQVDGYIIDIKRGDLLIEIQSGNVSKIRGKIARLIQEYPMRLLLPIAKEKWIVRLDEDGTETISRRKSPKRGSFLDLFSELVSIPKLILDENLSVEVILTREEEVRQHEPGRAWRRRGWVVRERRLLEVVDRRDFSNREDVATFLPVQMVDPFTTADLVEHLSIKPRLARQMAYCLRKVGVINAVGKRGNFKLYTRAKPH